MNGYAVFALLLFGCSSSDAPTKTQTDCDVIADSIRTAAQQRNIPASGVCNSTDPAVQKDFSNACSALRDCNDHCCK